MASLKQNRFGVFYVQYYTEKGQKRKSLRTKNREIAKKLLRQFENTQDLVKSGLIDAPIIPAKAFEKYLQGKSVKDQVILRYRQHWHWIESFLQERSIGLLNDLTAVTVSEYPNWRQAAKKTIQEELRLLKSIMTWLTENGYLRANPVNIWPKIKTTTKKPETIGSYSKGEVERILAHFNEHPAGSALSFLAFTGVRRSEMEAICVADVDLEKGVLRIKSEKTATMTSNQIRYVEIHPRIADMLKTKIAGKAPDAPVFPETQKHRPAWLTQLLETACRQLKIQYRRVHGLRHYWITSLLSAGVPLAVVMRMAGHSNLSTTQKYLHLGEHHHGWVEKI
ncbi:MAG: site-specific integrase [Candidatus Riflebacteria bacterium]|nr:site-specific integrase [Candidatus Riflebacteria bacterium]